MSDLTRVLEASQRGDAKAAEELLPLVYQELRRLAAHKMGHEAPGQTLQPTALVHEAWLRLVRSGQSPWEGRAHFFAAAAEAMRRILIERARRKRAQRHGGQQQRADIDTLDLVAPDKDERLLAMSDALDPPGPGNADDLPSRQKTIRRDRRPRTWQTRHSDGRSCRRFCAALNTVV